MPVVNVTVASIDTRTVNTKFGPKPVYTAVGTDGSKVNFNFTNPSKFKVNTGGTYTFTVEEGKYGYEFKEMGGAGPATDSVGSAAPASAYRGASARPFPVPVGSGETAIIRQNALTNAVNLYCNGRGVDSSVPDDEVAEKIIAMAYRFAEFSSGQREVRVADEMGGTEA